jgi:hypothetical protein
VIAGSIVLALTLSPFTAAQDAVPSQTISSSARRLSEDQLPDSPGTVQARPNQLQQIAAVFSQDDNNQWPDSGQTQSQEPNAATAQDTSATSSSTYSSPQSDNQAPETSSQSSQPSTPPSAQSQQTQQPQTPREPVGTAAAETIQTTGVAASRPAGAALAPAKQRRVRSILIKVGALVAVGAAVGTTMALSKGSPSNPPGAH